MKKIILQAILLIALVVSLSFNVYQVRNTVSLKQHNELMLAYNSRVKTVNYCLDLIIISLDHTMYVQRNYVLENKHTDSIYRDGIKMMGMYGDSLILEMENLEKIIKE